MQETRELLRRRFEAETDIAIELDPDTADWKQYALWLEIIGTEELNNETSKEVVFLRGKMQAAAALLDEGLTSRIN